MTDPPPSDGLRRAHKRATRVDRPPAWHPSPLIHGTRLFTREPRRLAIMSMEPPTRCPLLDGQSRRATGWSCAARLAPMRLIPESRFPCCCWPGLRKASPSLCVCPVMSPYEPNADRRGRHGSHGSLSVLESEPSSVAAPRPEEQDGEKSHPLLRRFPFGCTASRGRCNGNMTPGARGSH